MGQVKEDVILNVRYQIDQNSVNSMNSSLKSLQKMTTSQFQNLNPGLGVDKANERLKEVKQTAAQVQKALNDAFNPNLGTLNIEQFKNNLQSIGVSNITKDFKDMGAQGRAAWRNIATEVLTTNNQVKQSSQLLTKMGTTFANTIRWGITSSVWRSFLGTFEHAYSYTMSLDKSLNNIRIVTGKSAEEMDRFAKKANQAAKELAASTAAYTNASLIYYQQGKFLPLY